MIERRTDDNIADHPQFLDVSDLQALFGVGRSKARLIMDVLPSIRVGSRDYIAATALSAFIAENDGIPIKWPKRRRK